MKDKILLIEDDGAFSESIKSWLSPEAIEVDVASTGSEAMRKFKTSNGSYSVCILDYNLPDMTGTDVAQLIFRQNPNQEIMFMTADDRKETFRNMTSHGYTKNFLMKDDDPRILVNKIKETISQYNHKGRKFTGPVETASEIERDLKSIGLIGRSTALHKIYKEVLSLKETKRSVLILGESGTGKEHLASALNSTGSKYFPLNCASYSSGSENFLATQLFGHVKGAYTGADKDSTGVLERAHQGTVFLDEIHCMSPGSQRMLLRAVETKRIIKFGDTQNVGVQSDFRLICAGKPEIETLMHDDRFVKDLYYRIAEYVIRVPKLSERPEDIEPLILHFIETLNKDSNRKISIRAEAIRILEDFSWPGNVRDLKNTLTQLSLQSPDGDITRVDVERLIASRFKVQEPEVQIPLDERLDVTQIESIKKALRSTTSIRKAAAILQIPKSTLCYRLEKLKIDPSRYLLAEV
jgi:DNA-binding NtrC family response regulator